MEVDVDPAIEEEAHNIEVAFADGLLQWILLVFIAHFVKLDLFRVQVVVQVLDVVLSDAFDELVNYIWRLWDFDFRVLILLGQGLARAGLA